MTRAEAARRADAVEFLRARVPPGSTVYTILRRAGRSGMRRAISAVVIHDGEPFEISAWVARALGRRREENGGIVCDGTGLDMGFELVDSPARVVWPDSAPEVETWREAQRDAGDRPGGVFAQRNL